MRPLYGDAADIQRRQEEKERLARHSADAEQLSELRRLAAEARDVLALPVPYGKIHTVSGVAYPDGTHSEAVDRGERVLNQLRAVLTPQKDKETRS